MHVIGDNCKQKDWSITTNTQLTEPVFVVVAEPVGEGRRKQSQRKDKINTFPTGLDRSVLK